MATMPVEHRYTIRGTFPPDAPESYSIWDYLPRGAYALLFRDPEALLDWVRANECGPDGYGVTPTWEARKVQEFSTFLYTSDSGHGTIDARDVWEARDALNVGGRISITESDGGWLRVVCPYTGVLAWVNRHNKIPG